MPRLRTALPSFFVVVALSGTSTAANICGETVPGNRYVDGFPAYAQCASSNSAAIYSNNGIDTATSSAGSGWLRTQWSGGYQCTEWAHRYLYFRWNVPNVPNGNAGTWCDSTPPAGLEKVTTPVHGDLIVFAPGSCGADPSTGHVAVIDVVGSTAVTFVEQNNAGRRSCAISTAACFLHATANTGAATDGGTVDAGTDGGISPGRDGGGLDVSAGIPDARGSGGTLGSGGAVSAGGAMATGGIRGLAGAGGTETATGTGGSVTALTSTAASSKSGCSCGLATRTSSEGRLALLLVTAAAARPWRRRRR